LLSEPLLQPIVNRAYADWQVKHIPQQFHHASVRTVADEINPKINCHSQVLVIGR
jgi:hypothetical protein